MIIIEGEEKVVVVQRSRCFTRQKSRLVMCWLREEKFGEKADKTQPMVMKQMY
jgi:hypothetical protein